ncbi:MAG: transposase, partial [Planctomycetaceae bacterium]|nr:transposase [Planctomycetaceae bacterium]
MQLANKYANAYQSVLGIDETPMKQANSKSWLWAFVAKQFSVFQIRPTRSG